MTRKRADAKRRIGPAPDARPGIGLANERSARPRIGLALAGGGPLGAIYEIGALCALDEALRSLEQMDPQKGRIVELRYFGGLSVEETAEVLNISPRTVRREWQRSKAWLYRMISEGTADETRPLAKD